MDARLISDALGGRRCGKGYIMRCVSHDDKSPSLSITDSDNGVLVYCHAGCAFSEISSQLRSMGLWPESTLSHDQKQHFIEKKSRYDLFHELYFEMRILNQITEARIQDYCRSRNRSYKELHPEFMPMPDEPWESEQAAAMIIRKVIGDLYG